MRFALAVVLALAVVVLAGCGTVRALAGPDPALLAAAPDIAGALDRDSAANPSMAPANERGKVALEGAVNPTFPPPPPLPGLPWLEPALWAIGSVVTSLGARHALKKREAKKAAKAAVAPPGTANKPA